MKRAGLACGVLGLVALFGAATAVFWGDVVQSSLDPKVPFQTYKPPSAPDYGDHAAWLRRDGAAGKGQAADVFFIGPTTYDGGREWNAPSDDPEAATLFREVMAPNYVGPFERVGRIFAPSYRQASVYTMTTLREDAREARRFAYGDIARAFRRYMADDNEGRPFVIVGVEQGGLLAQRLVAEEVTPRPHVSDHFVAAYVIEAPAPADTPAAPPCMARAQAGCLAAWASVREGRTEDARELLDRALVWTGTGELTNLHPRPALCFNPILGQTSDAPAPARLHLGAANATGLERGARPAFLKRQVAARCVGGVLQVSQPKSASLLRSGGWLERRRAAGFNLFYADIEADALARLAAWESARVAQAEAGLPVEQGLQNP